MCATMRHLTQLGPQLFRFMLETFLCSLCDGGSAALFGQLRSVALRLAVLRLEPLLRCQRGLPPGVSFALHLAWSLLSDSMLLMPLASRRRSCQSV